MEFLKGNEAKPNVFHLLEEKRQEMIQQGRDVINLSIGTPDLQPNSHVLEAVCEASRKPENYRYALTDLPKLQESVAHWYQRRYGVALERSEMMSVSGSQEGIAHIAFPFVGAGDLVLSPNPGYPIFSFGPLSAGATVGLLPLKEEQNYLIDLDAVAPSVAHDAKMMVVSYPNNPTTATADATFYEKLVFFAKKYDIMVLHDNAYSDLTLDGTDGISFLSVKGAKEVGIEFNSLSKTYNLTGMRVSFALGNASMLEKFQSFRTQIDYGMFLPAQYGAIAALDGSQEIVQHNRQAYRTRAEVLCHGLQAIGWHVEVPKATMFVWAKIPAHYTDSAKFSLDLLEQTGVICVPGENFGTLGAGYVRFALVVPPARMQEVVDRIAQSTILKG